MSNRKQSREAIFLEFLDSLRLFFPCSKKMQFFNLLIKYIPLIMISHEININKSKKINTFFGYFSLNQFIKYFSTDIIILYLYLILIFILIFSFFLIKFYIQIRKNFKNNGNDLRFTTKLNPFLILFLIFNQNLYEILFSLFLCKVDGKDTNLLIMKFDCYDSYRLTNIVISILIIIFLMLINFFHNLTFFQPWFCSDSIYPTGFLDRHLFWTIIPLLQGYLVLENNLSNIVSMIIRYIIRGIFLIYLINFYLKSSKLIYPSRIAYVIILFLNSTCFVSILLEFIPLVVDNLSDINLLIVKLVFQLLVTFIIIYYILKKEKKVLANFIHTQKKNNMGYEILNKYLYILINIFNGDEDSIKLILNKYFNCDFNLENVTDNREIHKNIKSFLKTIKSSKKSIRLFKNFRNSENDIILQKNLRNLINNKLKFYIDYLDKILIYYIDEYLINDKKSKYIILYSLFCYYFKFFHITSLYYIEKLTHTKLYKNNLQAKLFFLQIKKSIGRDHFSSRVQINSEKNYLKVFFSNLDHFDKITDYIDSTMTSLKELIFKINEKNVYLNSFLKVFNAFLKQAKTLSFTNNKELKNLIENINKNSESIILLNKLETLNKYIFGKKDWIIDSSQNEKIFECNNLMKSNKYSNDELYMVLHLNNDNNIIIDKICDRLLVNLDYDKSYLNGRDLRILLPTRIAKFHEEKTSKYLKSNRDFRKLNIYFITRDNFAFPLHMTSIILPTLGKSIVFYSLFHDSYNEKAIENINACRGRINISKINLFCEASDSGEITKINRLFESLLGISRDIVDSHFIKINIFKILEINQYEIFDNFQGKQNFYFTFPFMKFLENLKNFKFYNFVDNSSEAYNKIKNVVHNLKISKYEDIILKISIERIIIDYFINDYIFMIKIYPEFNLDNSIQFKSTYIKNHQNKSNSSKILMTMPILMKTDKNENKMRDIIKIISSISKCMIKEGSRLWHKHLKYSEIADNDEITLTDNCNESNKNENLLYPKNSSIFKIKGFIFFVILAMIFSAYSSWTLWNFINKYKISLEIYNITENLLNIKYSFVMLSLSVIKSFSIQTGKMNPKYSDYSNLGKLKQELISNYLNSIDESIYSLNSRSMKLDQTLQKQFLNFMDIKDSYNILYNDLSVYSKNYTIIDIIKKIKLNAYQIQNFDNLTFNHNTNLYNNNFNNNLDLNKLPKIKQDTETGNLVIYFIAENTIEKIIPLFDNLINENIKIQNEYISRTTQLQFIYFSILVLFLLLIFIYLLFAFYLEKNYIYKRYFVNYNILKFFNLYLLQKIQFLDYLMLNYTKQNLEYYKNLYYDVQKLDARHIRYDLECNKLNVTIKETKKMKIKKYKSFQIKSKIRLETSISHEPPIKKASRIKIKKSNQFLNINSDFNKINCKTKNSDKKQVTFNTNEEHLISTESNIKLIKEQSNVNNDFDLKSLALLNLKNVEPKNSSNYSIYKDSKNFRKSSIFENNYGLSKETNLRSSKNIRLPFTKKINFLTKSDDDLNKNKKKIYDDILFLNESKAPAVKKDVVETENVNIETNEILIDDNITKTLEDNSYIDTKNLLRKNSNFYFDNYIIMVIIFIFLSLNLVTFFESRFSLNNLDVISEITNITIQKSYSEFEISLIYAITLLRNKNFPLFVEKTNSYININNKSKEFINSQPVLFSDLFNYLNQLNTENACKAIFENYNKVYSSLDSVTNEKCLKSSNSIFNKGYELGIETLMKIMNDNFNENDKNSFMKFKNNFDDESLNLIFYSEKGIIEENIINIKNLIQKEIKKLVDNYIFYFNLYYVLYSLLSIVLLISYCSVFYFIFKSLQILYETEKILKNLVRL